MADTSTELESSAENSAEDGPDIGPESTPEPNSEQSPAAPSVTETEAAQIEDAVDEAPIIPEDIENSESVETTDSPEEPDISVDEDDSPDDAAESGPAEDGLEEPADTVEPVEEASPPDDDEIETEDEAEDEAKEEVEEEVEIEEIAGATEAQKWEDDSETAPDSTPPSTLEDRYDIYPGRPLAGLDSPSARAFEAEDRMQPQLKLFALICIPGLPVRWDEIEAIEGRDLPGNMALAAFGNIDWPIQNQKCLALIFERPMGGQVDNLLKDPHAPE